MKHLKIVNKRTGQESSGGRTPYWVDMARFEGKMWDSLANVKKHLLQIFGKPFHYKHNSHDYNKISEIEVVEYELVETRRVPLEDVLIEMGILEVTPIKILADRFRNEENDNE